MPSKAKSPRVNKSKEQIAAQIAQVQKVDREKMLVKLMFPIIENMKTIYDAQTVLQALSGFIKAKVDQKAAEFFVKDLQIDLSKEEDSEIKTAMEALLGLIEIEKGKDIAGLLERFGNILAQHSAREFMKQSMREITLDKIIAPDKK